MKLLACGMICPFRQLEISDQMCELNVPSMLQHVLPNCKEVILPFRASCHHIHIIALHPFCSEIGCLALSRVLVAHGAACGADAALG